MLLRLVTTDPQKREAARARPAESFACRERGLNRECKIKKTLSA